MQKLQTVNAETLLYEPLEKPSFVVDSLIPTGLSLFCGSQKIGKSWLMLKLCLCVSQGIPLWDMTTMEGDVLYLCLEDTFCRIQDRLFRLTDEASGRLHFAVASCKLSDGLIVQLRRGQDDRPAFYPPDGTDTADFADGGRGENRPHTCGGTVLFEERRAGKSLCHDGERRSNALTLTGTADEKHEPERAA